MSITILAAPKAGGRPRFREAFIRLVQCWALVLLVLSVAALVLGPITGYGVGGLFVVALLGLFAFVLALPGSVVALVILGRLELGGQRSVAVRFSGMLVVFLLASASIVLVSLPLYSSGFNWGISDYLGWLLFTAPTAVVWALR